MEDSLIDPIVVVIRFASSHPDLHLTIEDAARTSILGLKRLVRAALDEAEKQNAMRLIYAGRVLNDKASIAQAVGHKKWNHRNAPRSDQEVAGVKGKGKARAAPGPTVYIHCAISSNTLTTEELAAEVAGAAIAPTSPTAATAAPTVGVDHTPSTGPQTRGFDRLGFSDEDVASLRAQHRSLIAARFTPDTMPSEEAMLDMEERWLESGAAGLNTAGGLAADGTTEGAGGLEDDHAAQLMDTLYGAVMGFFWPIGCMIWGLREEGLWSRRRRDAVMAGVFLNIGFAIMRIASWSG